MATSLVLGVLTHKHRVLARVSCCGCHLREMVESDGLSPWMLALSEAKRHSASKWQISATHMANGKEDEEREEPGPGIP